MLGDPSSVLRLTITSVVFQPIRGGTVQAQQAVVLATAGAHDFGSQRAQRIDLVAATQGRGEPVTLEAIAVADAVQRHHRVDSVLGSSGDLPTGKNQRQMRQQFVAPAQFHGLVQTFEVQETRLGGHVEQ